jgi:hypothetical protein
MAKSEWIETPDRELTITEKRLVAHMNSDLCKINGWTLRLTTKSQRKQQRIRDQLQTLTNWGKSPVDNAVEMFNYLSDPVTVHKVRVIKSPLRNRKAQVYYKTSDDVAEEDRLQEMAMIKSLERLRLLQTTMDISQYVSTGEAPETLRGRVDALPLLDCETFETYNNTLIAVLITEDGNPHSLSPLQVAQIRTVTGVIVYPSGINCHPTYCSAEQVERARQFLHQQHIKEAEIEAARKAEKCITGRERTQWFFRELQV